MQKWKKFLATLTAGALCAVALPLAKLELPEVVMNAAAAECTVPVGTGTTTLTYEVQEDDTVEITDCEDTAAGELEIPAEIDGWEPLQAAGRKRGFLVSGGEVDTERMARVLLEEYRSCKLGKFTLERPEELA